MNPKVLEYIATDVFTKGDWNGLLFFKLEARVLRNKVVAYLRKVRLEYEGKVVWVKEYLLI